MRMKNSEVITKMSALADIINRKERYPVKFSFALSKNARALETASRDFVEARKGILDECNVKDESGSPAYRTTGKIEIAEPYRAVFRESMDELLEIEVEVPVHTVNVSVLDGLDIEPDILYTCDFMFE